MSDSSSAAAAAATPTREPQAAVPDTTPVPVPMVRPRATDTTPPGAPTSVASATPEKPGTAGPQRPRRRPIWAGWPDEKLLDVRMCDLGMSIEGTVIERRIRDLHGELAARGITFRSHFWLSNDWFTPDDVPGVAIPFYLAHPRLARLELTQLLEVEGGTKPWCMRILRHEMGHAIDNAYCLQRRRKRQKLFGLSSTPYPEYYTPRPHSKSFVLHLDSWYGQSHPDEDFAETFAVWLDPRSVWSKRYADWPALKKLEYMDALMSQISGTDPLVTTQRMVEPLSSQRKTLREHYAEKRKRYGLEYPDFYDRDLRKLFSDAPEHTENVPAAKFLVRVRRDVRRLVARWTGEYQYRIDQVLNDMIARCEVLELHLAIPEDRAKPDFMVLLTVQTMNYLHGGRHRIAL
jgi:hypothetical protein